MAEKLGIYDFIDLPPILDKSKPVKLFEAFAGYGSQQMALKRLGVDLEVVGYSEIDKYAIQVYEALHGKHKNYGGIGSFDKLPACDIATWSFPCQDISNAGNQKGMVDGSRSNYGYVFLETVEATSYEERPKVLLMENVKALMSKKFELDMIEIKQRLESMGYSNYIDVLNSRDFGVAQSRDRVFIVSVKDGATYTETYEFPKRQKLTKRLKHYLEDKVDEKYYLNDNFIKQITKDVDGYDRKGKFTGGIDDGSGISRTITTKLDRPESTYVLETTEESYTIIEKTNNKDAKVYKTKEADFPRHRIYDTNSIGFTITTAESQQPAILLNDYRIRKLTPREALRLMDVSESDIDIILSEVSNTQAYKLAGNSIVVNVLVEIFKQLF